MNYAMHPVNFYLRGVISADFPGEASRYIEDLYGNGAVAIFSQGASGDQNPRLTERGQTTVGAAPAPPAPPSSPPVAPAANSDRGFSPAAAQAERAAIPAAELAAYKAGSPARELSSS